MHKPESLKLAKMKNVISFTKSYSILTIDIIALFSILLQRDKLKQYQIDQSTLHFYTRKVKGNQCGKV